MKKFLVFCLICIVTVSLGLMTYRFLTLEESVVVNQTVFEVNVNEEIPLDINVLNSKGSVPKVTSSNDSLIYYDESLEKFMAKDKGGKATFTIEPLNSSSTPIIVTVTVGDGTEQSPYFIKSAEDLAMIGKATIVDGQTYYARPLNAYYKLIADINLSTYNNGSWTPIGSTTNAFTGVINCNNHAITGLKITESVTSAGLFAQIGANEKGVANITGGLIIEQANINGSFTCAGTLAGINFGVVEKVTVSSSSVISTGMNASVGGLIGTQYGESEKITILKTNVKASGSNASAGGIVGMLLNTSSQAILNRSYCEGVDVNASLNAGGLVGISKGGIIVNSYAKKVQEGSNIFGKISTDSTATDTSLGGLVARVEITGQKKTSVVDCYAVVEIKGVENQKRGQLIGYVVDTKSGDVTTKNDIYGLYYEASNSNLLGLGYIQNIGYTTLTTQTQNYPNVYNDLYSQATTKNTLFSHISSDNKQCNWASEVWTLLSNDYPVLDLDGPYFDIYTIIGSIYDETKIETAEQLYQLCLRVNQGNEKETKLYTIMADIDLSAYDWQGIGTEANPFKSILTCETDSNGMPKWKITGLKISAGTTANESYASTYKYQGLFGVIAGQGKVSNLYIENPQVKRGQYTGGIAGINYGVINNCYVVSTDDNATIETNNIGYKNGSTTEDNIYIGGIAGFNNGTIAKCQVQGVLIQQSNALNSQTTLSMGGIAGVNAQIIEDCAVKGVATNQGKNLITTNKAGTQYIGGIAGVNSYVIKSSFASKGDSRLTIKASTGNKSSYIGGLVGLCEQNAKIELSFADVNVEGANVGGLASISYGLIDQCYASGELTGLNVGGLAYKIENGTVSNCYVSGAIYGINKNSTKAGFVVELTLVNANERNASVVHCFANVNFDNTGSNYYDSKSRVRLDESGVVLKYHRIAGFVIESIYNRSTDNATRSNEKYWPWDKFPWRDTETIINNYNNDKAKYSYLYDCGLTTEQITSEDGASVFRTYGFDESIWQLGGGNVPTLKNVVKYK